MFAKIIPTLVSVSNEGNFLCIKSKGLKFVFPTLFYLCKVLEIPIFLICIHTDSDEDDDGVYSDKA